MALLELGVNFSIHPIFSQKLSSQRLLDCMLVQATDLAYLMVTCRDLRSLASADEHWERVTTAEFSELYEHDVINAQRLSWMRLYKTKRLEREAKM